MSFARRRPEGRLITSSLGVRIVPIIRNGKVWGERYRYDNRLLMATLTRLDRLTRPFEDTVPIHRFDELVELACAGAAQEHVDEA